MWLPLPCSIFLDLHFSHLNYPSLQRLYKALHNTQARLEQLLLSEHFPELQSSGLRAHRDGFSVLPAVGVPAWGAAGTLRWVRAVRVSRGTSGASVRHLGRITHQML